MSTKPDAKTAKATATAKPAKAAKAAKVGKPVLATPLSGEALTELLKLTTQAKSIELKLSVPLASHRATIQSIGFDPVEAQPRMAFFFDTPDLALNRAGIAVRARRSQGGIADTVIKLRPVDPAEVDKDLRALEDFKVEVDAMPGGFVCSASFKGICRSQDVRDVAAGTLPLRKLFSKEQRAFYDAHAPAGLTMDKLVVLGPTFLLKAKHLPKDFDYRLVIELWLYPDGSRILELSTKCPPNQTFQVAAEFKAYLAKHGVVLGKDQSAKTKTSLEFFAARLKEEQAAGKAKGT
jgi:hypothetical protein